MPPKLVPTSMPASARKKRADPSSAISAIRSAVGASASCVVKIGTSPAASQMAVNIT